MFMEQTPEKLLLENKAWSDEVTRRTPDFFNHLSKDQKPEFLWIGCSDSRVPADTIVNAQPGQIFAHRNIANQVITTDFNCLSVLQYAVDVLNVKHIIVCGHYGCGGIKAALEPQRSELVIANKWLMHIKDIYRLHQDVLEMEPENKRLDRLIEVNIIEQVYRLAHTSIIQSAWKHKHQPTIHGWVYGLNDGLIKELIKLDNETPINPLYQYI